MDADSFERLAGEGRKALDGGDARGAHERLRAALELWRGPPLGDVAYEPFAQNEVARLEELRLVALENRCEADLALGRHAALIPELEGLVSEHPTRERLREELMLALYRSGRQVDALECYRDAQRTACRGARARARVPAATAGALHPRPGPGDRRPSGRGASAPPCAGPGAAAFSSRSAVRPRSRR